MLLRGWEEQRIVEESVEESADMHHLFALEVCETVISCGKLSRRAWTLPIGFGDEKRDREVPFAACSGSIVSNQKAFLQGI